MKEKIIALYLFPGQVLIDLIILLAYVIGFPIMGYKKDIELEALVSLTFYCYTAIHTLMWYYNV